MADLFRNWKKVLNTSFVDKWKTPEFTGRYEKIRDHWPAFEVYKQSDKGKKRSVTNKKMLQRRRITIIGGYYKARPLWDKAKEDLLAKGVQPVTLN